MLHFLLLRDYMRMYIFFLPVGFTVFVLTGAKLFFIIEGMRKFLFTLVLVMVSFSFTGCLQFLLSMMSADENESSQTDLGNSEWYYNLGDNTSVTIDNVLDKEIIFVKFNNSNNVIQRSDQRTLYYTDGIDTSSDKIESYDGSKSYSYRSLSDAVDKAAVVAQGPIHFEHNENYGPVYAAPSSRAVSTDSVDYKDFTKGYRRNFWADTDISSSISYEQKAFTLRAGNSSCLVWVADDCYSAALSRGSKVTTAIAESIAATFAEHCGFEREVFGTESSMMIDEYNYANIDMASKSDTGTLVNILLYDIGNDYSSSNASGVIGYFSSKDYYVRRPSAEGNTKPLRYSNEGKFFYIDAPFCNYNSSATGSFKFGGTDGVSQTVISTLFHEFQHMINFGNKVIEGGVSDNPSWHNEMLSMLAEDLMAQQLGLDAKENVAANRIPLFNRAYYNSGLTEYLKDTGKSIYSYSTAYAFGAWIAREYGGPAFIENMSKNAKTGMDSITDAIYATTGKSVSPLVLYKKFIQACVYRNTFAQNYGYPTLNKSIDSRKFAYGISAGLGRIDIFSSDYKYQYYDRSSDYYTGPCLISYDAAADELRPHGFTIHYVGRATSDTVVLEFSQRQSSGEQIMIYVQDSFTNKIN